jgi:hypothetical protein
MILFETWYALLLYSWWKLYICSDNYEKLMSMMKKLTTNLKKINDRYENLMATIKKLMAIMRKLITITF